MKPFITMVSAMRDAQKRHEYTFEYKHLQQKKEIEAEVDNYIRSNDISELLLCDKLQNAEKIIKEWLENERIIDRTPSDDEKLLLIRQKAMAFVNFDVK